MRITFGNEDQKEKFLKLFMDGGVCPGSEEEMGCSHMSCEECWAINVLISCNNDATEQPKFVVDDNYMDEFYDDMMDAIRSRDMCPSNLGIAGANNCRKTCSECVSSSMKFISKGEE